MLSKAFGNLLLDNNSVVGEKLLKVSSKVSANVSAVVRKLLGTPIKVSAPELPLVIQDAAIAKAKKFLGDTDPALSLSGFRSWPSKRSYNSEWLAR